MCYSSFNRGGRYSDAVKALHRETSLPGILLVKVAIMLGISDALVGRGGTHSDALWA